MLSRRLLESPAEICNAGLHALKRTNGALKALKREIKWCTIVRLKHQKSYCICRVLVQNFLERVEVTQRLGHLLTVNAKHSGVHPIIGERSVPGARCLSSLVLMVREYQVRATAVNVNWSAQVAMNHCAALTVPTWTTFSPRAWPARLTRLSSLPECKVKWIAFLVINLNALTCAKLIKIATRKHTITMVRTNREVHVARRHRVCVTLFNQRLNHLKHGFNLMCCARANIRI